MDIQTLMAWKPDYSSVDAEKFQKFKESKTYGRDLEFVKFSEILDMADEFLGYIAPEAKLEVKAYGFGYASAHYVIEGAGFG